MSEEYLYHNIPTDRLKQKPLLRERFIFDNKEIPLKILALNGFEHLGDWEPKLEDKTYVNVTLSQKRGESKVTSNFSYLHISFWQDNFGNIAKLVVSSYTGNSILYLNKDEYEKES